LSFVGLEDIKTWFKRQYPGQPQYRYEDAADEVAAHSGDAGELRMRRLCAYVQKTRSAFSSPRP
jgi:hypothetical protein